MSNESTKAQLERFIVEAIRKRKNPDPREQMIAKRSEKRKRIAGKFAL